jgi:hypothetical protein
MTRAHRVVAFLSLLGLVLVGPAEAFEAEIARYHAAVVDICRTGVTERIVVAYEQARRALAQARYGGGQGGNFWGLRSPEQFLLDCFQAPGDGKT